MPSAWQGSLVSLPWQVRNWKPAERGTLLRSPRRSTSLRSGIDKPEISVGDRQHPCLRRVGAESHRGWISLFFDPNDGGAGGTTQINVMKDCNEHVASLDQYLPSHRLHKNRTDTIPVSPLAATAKYTHRRDGLRDPFDRSRKSL